MSDTPQTDDQIGYEGSTMTFVRIDFARRLERELNAAKAALSGRTVSCSNCNELARENAEMRETLTMAAAYLRVFSPDNPKDKLAKLKRRLKPFLK